MEIRKEIKSFMESDDFIKQYEFVHYKDHYVAEVQKRPIKDSNLINIYKAIIKKKEGDFASIKYDYSFTYDSSSLEVVYASNDALRDYSGFSLLEDASYEDFNKYTRLKYNLDAEINNKVLERLRSQKERFLKEIDFSKYESEYEEMYKKSTDIKEPTNFINFELTFDKIAEYYKNPKRFVYKEIKKCINEETINEYKKYLTLTYGFKEYINKLENDDLGKIKGRLLSLINDDTHKTLNICYKKPNGTKDTYKFVKKDEYGDFGTQIQENECINKIPIKAITQIMYRQKPIYERDIVVSSSFEYPMSEQILDNIKLRNYNVLPESVFSDIIYRDALWKSDFRGQAISKMDYSILTKDFLLEKINKDNVMTVLQNIPGNDVFNSPELFKKIIPFIEQEISSTKDNFINFVLPEFDRSIINTPENAKLLFKMINEFNREFVDLFDNSILNSEDVLKEIYNFDAKKIPVKYLLTKITESEKILMAFPKEVLQNYISYINENTLVDDRALLLTILDDLSISSKFFDNKDNRYVYCYQDDDEIIDKIICAVDGEYNVEELAKILGLDPVSDKEKIYEIAGEKNVEFLSLLNEDDKLLYLRGEAFEAKEVTDMYSPHVLRIKSSYGYFVIDEGFYNTKIRFQGTFHNNIGHSIELSNNSVNEIKDILLKNIKETYKDDKSSDFLEFIKNNQALKESLNKEEDIER